MKLWGKLFIALAVGTVLSAQAFAQNRSLESYRTRAASHTLSAPARAFVPTGFDNNDNVQIVVSGALPNTCYQVGLATYRYDASRKIFWVQVQVEHDAPPGKVCLFMTIEYERVVEIGKLPAGRYTVAGINGSGAPVSLGGFSVKAVTPLAATHQATTYQATDDQTYLPVKSVRVVRQGRTSLDIELEGEASSDCLALDRVVVVHNKPDVYELLPIAKIEKPQNCQRPAARTVKMRTPVRLTGFQMGQSLIHVRSLNGSAINQLVKFE